MSLKVNGNLFVCGVSKLLDHYLRYLTALDDRETLFLVFVGPQ